MARPLRVEYHGALYYLTSRTASASFRAPATVTFTATAQDTDGAISRVEFYQGTTLVGTATAAPYTATLANLAPGAYTYTARAYDNDGGAAMSSAIAVRVNGPPTVAITSPVASATFARGATVSLTANASDADGTVSKVEFYANGALLGAATTSPFTYAWTASSSGAYTLTAVATDNDGATMTSAAVAIRVNAVPQVTITAPAQNTVTNAPGSLTVSATASDADGNVVKVEFYANGSVIGGATQAPYSITWSSIPAGSYSLTAIATDNDGGTTTSAPVSMRVNGYPTVMLTSPTASTNLRAPATVTFTATAQDIDGAINRVEFYAGTTLVATVTAAPYTYIWTNVAAGSYSLTARAVDDAGAGTVSAPVAITIASAEAQIYYIHTDHLNTPRMIANAQREVVWMWMNDDPFGANPANEDPRNTGSSFTCNLRFPGQYFDKETNLHYNYFRDYDPSIGRYVQSDPIGLAGGFNMYAYVGSNPLIYDDPYGLFFRYSIAQKTLTWVDPNTGMTSPSTTWQAVSGPWGRGALPQGWYQVAGEEPPARSEQRSMQDICGNVFKFRLYPQFSTRRTGLLIHPDGGVPGTAGCIGVTGCTTSLRSFMNSVTQGGGRVNLIVTP